MSRLLWKLLLAMIALAIATVFLSGVFARRVTHEQVKHLLINRAAVVPPRHALAVEKQYRSTGNWAGIESTLDRVATDANRQLVLTTPERKVITVSQGELRSAVVEVTKDDRVTASSRQNRLSLGLVIRIRPAPIRDAAGVVVGLLYFLPAESVPGGPGVDGRTELAAIDRGLLSTFTLAGLIAIVLSSVVARRITRPVEQLTRAVEGMSRGDLAVRVPESGRDEIGQLARSFNTMADSLATQRELRQRMVNDVAHELRTPLTNVRCELEALQDGLSVPDAETIASIHSEVLQLGRLVDDLQELAVAEAGRLELNRQLLDLSGWIAEEAETLRSEARRHGLEIEVSPASRLIVNADAMRLKQVLRNLVSNAITHTGTGGRITVAVRAVASSAEVAVGDTGEGIPAAELERVFERFYRLDPSRSRNTGGVGLGLAIVRQIVEAHGGGVRAESEPGKGSTFYFSIPLVSS